MPVRMVTAGTGRGMTIEEQFWVVERKVTRGLWSWRDLPFFAATCEADALVRRVRRETRTVVAPYPREVPALVTAGE